MVGKLGLVLVVLGAAGCAKASDVFRVTFTPAPNAPASGPAGGTVQVVSAAPEGAPKLGVVTTKAPPLVFAEAGAERCRGELEREAASRGAAFLVMTKAAERECTADLYLAPPTDPSVTASDTEPPPGQP